MGTFNVWSKEMLMQMKEAIIRLKKQNKPIRQMAETLGAAKSAVWNILERRNALADPAIPKGLEDHRRRLKRMIAELFPW